MEEYKRLPLASGAHKESIAFSRELSSSSLDSDASGRRSADFLRSQSNYVAEFAKRSTPGEERLESLIEDSDDGHDRDYKFATVVRGVLETLKETKQVLLLEASKKEKSDGGGEFQTKGGEESR